MLLLLPLFFAILVHFPLSLGLACRRLPFPLSCLGLLCLLTSLPLGIIDALHDQQDLATMAPCHDPGWVDTVHNVVNCVNASVVRMGSGKMVTAVTEEGE